LIMERKLKILKQNVNNVQLKITEDQIMLPIITRRSYRPFFLNGLFDDDFLPATTSLNRSVPAVNVRENEKSFALDVAIPGINKKDIKIDLNDDLLTISHEVKNESEKNGNDYKRREFSYSSFCRSFQVPDSVNKDKIEASYKDGILNITLPKYDEEKHKLTRQVKVS